MCPQLFAVQRFMNPNATDPDPLSRLGLKNPDKDKLMIVACTYSAYHALKFKVAPMFAQNGQYNPLELISFETQMFFIESFAKAFRAEAAEIGLNTRFFDSSEFSRSTFHIQNSQSTSGELPQRLPESDLTRDPPQLPANRNLTGSRTVRVSSARSPDIMFAPATEANAQNPVLHQAHSGTG